MEYSILIPFYSGDGYREKNLKSLLDYYLEHTPNSTTIIVVEQLSHTDFSDYINHPQFTHVKQPMGNIYKFNKSSAWNYGMNWVRKNKVKSEFVLMLDADIIIEKHFLDQYKLKEELKDFDMVHPFKGICDLQKFETFTFVRNYHEEKYDLNVNLLRSGTRCYGGALFIRVTTFFEVGGFDERFDAWGHEDDVFYYLVRRYVGPFRVKRTVGLIFHLYHPPLNTEEYIKGPKYRELAFIKSKVLGQIFRKGSVHKYIRMNRIRNGII